MPLKTATLIYPALKIERQPPIALGSHTGFMSRVDMDLPAVRLFNYKNVNVTPEGIVFKNLQADKDLLIYPKHKSIYNWLYLCSTLIKRKKTKLPASQKYLLCFDYWSNSIFHWMCDAMPRIEAVKAFAKDCVLLLPEFYEYAYILETLKVFEFKGVYKLKDSEYLHCPNLYAVEQVTTSGQIRPDNILSLRQTLLQHFEPKFTGRFNYPNIYISRNKAKYRKVLNETDLLGLLDKYNFKLIFLEDYTVDQQMEICYYAKNVVSIHGANLTNIICMQPGGQVLELRKRGDVMNNYYYELADSIGCRYFYLDCEFEDPQPEKNIFSLYVNPQQFETALQQLIKSL